MTVLLPPMNPLEEALNKLDLKGTILLITLLSQRAMYLKEQEDLKNTKVSKILTPNPLST